MDERAAAVQSHLEFAPRNACVQCVPREELVDLSGLHCLGIHFPFKAIPKVGLPKISKEESFGLRSQLAYLNFSLLPPVSTPPVYPLELENQYLQDIRYKCDPPRPVPIAHPHRESSSTLFVKAVQSCLLVL